MVPPMTIVALVIPSLRKHGTSLPILLILLFCAFVTVYSIILQVKRLRNFKELRINDKRILAIYSNRKSIRIEWNKVNKILVETSPRKKTVKVCSRDYNVGITIDSAVKDFELLMGLIRKYTKISLDVKEE